MSLTFHQRWSCVGLLQQNTWLACLCPSPPPEHLLRSLFHTPGLKPWWWPWPSPLSPAYDPSDRPQFLTEGCGRQTASCSWSGSKYRVNHHSSLGLCRRQPERWSDRLLDRTPHPQPSSVGVWQWHGSHGHGPSIHSTGGVAGRTTPQCTHCCCLQILSALRSVAARDDKGKMGTYLYQTNLNLVYSLMHYTRRANAQTIHICHTYRTYSQSSPLHNQPSWTFELLHAALQQNDCKSSTFPHNSVTVSEHQGHSNWNQTVEFSSV